MIRKFLAGLTVVVLVLASPAEGAAQPGIRRVPVWVAIAPAWNAGDGVQFRLLRFGPANPADDVIFLAPGADSTVLTEAIHALVAVRRETGDWTASDANLRVRGSFTRDRSLPWASRVLQDARASRPRQVPRVGNVQAVRIWLPVQRGQPSRPAM